MLHALIFATLLGKPPITAVQAEATTSSCRPEEKAENIGNFGKPRGPATIVSPPISVPAFRVRFVMSDSKKEVIPRRVSVGYAWQWLEYPYPEHSRGAWGVATDIFRCDPAAVVEVNAYQVQPRGWYNGKYAKRPKFDGVGIIADIEHCGEGRGFIHPGDISKLRTKIAVLYIGCSGDSKLRLEKD